ncbi:MAG: hypothetical protein U0Q07_19255, partial [Acidimicrobiales bacterium]
ADQFRFDAVGWESPLGHSVKKLAAVVPVTVTFNVTAVASAGTPPTPATWTSRTVPAAHGDEYGPTCSGGGRESKIRVGAPNGWNSAPVGVTFPMAPVAVNHRSPSDPWTIPIGYRTPGPVTLETCPEVVIWPSRPAVELVNQRFPSVAAVMPVGYWIEASLYDDTTPAVLIRPIEPFPRFVNHNAPSGPDAIPYGWEIDASENDDTAPAVVIRPTRWLPVLVNQSAPSGPDAIPPGWEIDASANDDTAPAVVIRPTR